MSGIRTAPACALGLTRDDLSAWRDGLLPAAERERIRVHVAGCDACREHLTDFEALAADLRGQRVPEPDERLWREVRAAITAGRRRRMPLALPAALADRRVWRALGAVAAVLLVVAGFARLLYIPPAEAPKHPLVWHEVKLPSDLTGQGAYTSIGLAPGGQTAYACNIAPNASSPQITFLWVTRDGGATWQHATKLGLFGGDNGAPTTCAILADASDPTVVVAIFTYVSGGVSPERQAKQAFVTLNGGLDWNQLSGFEGFTRLVTRQGTTYALRTDPAAPDASPRLSLSSDRFQTWRTLDDDIVAAGERVIDFWLDPASNTVLAATDKGGLWQNVSGDGKRWTALTPPLRGNFTARSPGAGRPLRICGDTPRQSDRGSEIVTFCSADDGATWTTLPSLNNAFTCGTTCARQNERVLGIGGDGALLVRAAADGATADTGKNDVVYRLLPGAAKWESLGAIPVGSVADDALFAPGSAPGLATDTLWAFSLGIHAADGAQGLAGPGAHVYTADYPPGTTPTPAPEPSATTTALPARPLAWQPDTSPVGLTREVGPPALAVSPTDGNTAYLCDMTTSGTRAWATRDRGAHWSATAGLPSRVSGMPAGESFYTCSIWADDLSPMTTLVALTWSSPGTGNGFSVGADYATFDGGRSWRQVGLDQGQYQYQQIASASGAIYALRLSNTDGYRIWASADQMRTWRRVDAGIPEQVARFWLDRASGALLAQGGVGEGLGHLYSSPDRGATWTQLTPPAFDTAWAQRMQGNAGWRICTAILDYNAGPTVRNVLNCSEDGGKTWAARPALEGSPACPSCQASALTSGRIPEPPSGAARSPRLAASLGPGSSYGAGLLWLGFAGDGAFLRVAPSEKGADGAIGLYALYRLAPGAGGQWESLGPVPELTVSYARAPNGGVLWATPAVGVVLDEQKRLFTADYAA